MKLLLDTHIFLWFISGSTKLTNYSKDLIENTDNQRFLSLASLWEITIKISLGKLHISIPYEQLIQKHIYDNDIELLNIAPKHLSHILNLPFHHKDPFDRLIIAQAQCEDMSIISSDEQFKKYDTIILWQN